MIEVAIMIEAQNGLNWARWKRIARATEDLGFVGLYRSDHFTNTRPPDIDSLELWVSLAWLADNTTRIEFGPLVTPISFRSPVFTARMAKDVDDLSGGRLTLGLGAGWQDREHTQFGFDLMEPGPRFDRFEEGVQVVYRLLREQQPVSFSGEHFQLEEASLFPPPARPGGPPILIGGRGWKRTLPLAARYAEEWNCVMVSAEGFSKLNARLDQLLAERDRGPGEVRRSLMTGTFFSVDEADARRKAEARGQTLDQLQRQGMIAGMPSQVVDQLGRFEEAGVQRIMLQWLDLDDLEGLEALARTVLG